VSGFIEGNKLNPECYLKLANVIKRSSYGPSLMFAGKARGLTKCGAHESRLSNVGSGLTRKY